LKKRKPPEICPVCDAEVPPKAQACPDCGACYKSGWKEEDDDSSEEIDYDILDLPDEVLSDEERAAKEARLNRRYVSSWWRFAALGLVVLWFLVWWLSRSGWSLW
jgi:hypothetical protein